MRWVCVLGLLLALLHLSTSLLLGAFNIQIFGDKKSSNPTLMTYISTIVCRYDVILIQEVRDPGLIVTNRLMAAVNSRCPQFSYNYIRSEPLGPGKQKERYLYLYRVPMVSVVRNYTYNDPNGVFSRPPFIVEFSSQQTAVEKFVVIPQHTTPDEAVKQIDALYDVAADVKKNWKNKNIVLLGDFNAGGDYVSRLKWKEIRLFMEPGFHWLITDKQGTSVKTGNPYDRIVVTDDMMNIGVVKDSAGVYNFMTDFGLTEEQALDVSDHFPVEVTLKDKRKRKRVPES